MSETHISDIREENIDPLILESFKITKLLFTSTEQIDFCHFVSEVEECIQKKRMDKETISNIELPIS